jgi:hypothetical protein
MTLSRRFRDRDRFAGQHRFVDARTALDDDTIDWHRLAGAHAQPDHRRERGSAGMSSVGAVGRNPARGLWRKPQQRLDSRLTCSSGP